MASRLQVVLRTVYLYMRLRGELSLEDVDAQRRAMYKALLAPVLSALGAEGKWRRIRLRSNCSFWS